LFVPVESVYSNRPDKCLTLKVKYTGRKYPGRDMPFYENKFTSVIPGPAQHGQGHASLPVVPACLEPLWNQPGAGAVLKQAGKPNQMHCFSHQAVAVLVDAEVAAL
jgi:hypothetical protein